MMVATVAAGLGVATATVLEVAAVTAGVPPRTRGVGSADAENSTCGTRTSRGADVVLLGRAPRCTGVTGSLTKVSALAAGPYATVVGAVVGPAVVADAGVEDAGFGPPGLACKRQ